MYTKLGLVDLISAIQKRVEEGTGLRCYDAVPERAESPFYFIEFYGQVKADTKTMFRDNFTVYIHSIAEPSKSSVQVMELIQKLDEAMTEEITIPDEFVLMSQTNNGLQVIQLDETNEKHSVSSFSFMISYGFKMKV